MEQSVFNSNVEAYLLSDPTNKNLGIQSVAANVNLWNAGLVDSFRIMELVFFLEDLLGEEINFEHNIIGNFQSLEMMYRTLVLKTTPAT